MLASTDKEKKKIPLAFHEEKARCSLQIRSSATDFTDVHRLDRAVKGSHSPSGDITSAPSNLEKDMSHDGTKLAGLFVCF